MKYKVNQIIKHRWPSYPNWTCFSQVQQVDKEGITYKNIINISSDTTAFNIGNNYINFSVSFYKDMEIEIIGKMLSPEYQIKKLAPEYFL